MCWVDLKTKQNKNKKKKQYSIRFAKKKPDKLKDPNISGGEEVWENTSCGRVSPKDMFV